MFDLDGIRRINEQFEKQHAKRLAVQRARRDGLATVIKAPVKPLEERFNEALTSADAAWMQALHIKL